MAADVVMPRLSDSMEEGTVLRWLKQVGDEVRRGDELVEIETDKANMTYEATDEGTLTEILAQEGDTLPIGEVIARIGDAGSATSTDGRADEAEAPPSPAFAGSSPGGPPAPSAQGTATSSAATPPPPPAQAETPPASLVSQRAEPEGPPPLASAGSSPGTLPDQHAAAPAPDGQEKRGRIKASPIARRVAKDRGVELSSLRGSGPGGRIVKADVEAVGVGGLRPEAPPPPASAGSSSGGPPVGAPQPGAVEKAKGEVEVVELTKLQSTVARRMAESKATVPHFYLETEIDMSEAVKVREQLKRMAAEGSAVPTYNDMIVKACALALREFPRANGSYRDGRLELYSRINVGVAVAGEDALVVPTVFDADRKSLGEIATETKSLAGKVRDGTITPPDLSGGTFSVSNLGMFGVTNFSAVINPPQAGLLAIGALRRKPVADPDTGELSARHMMGATLACDHRILYGADGARLLARVRELLEQPLSLAL